MKRPQIDFCLAFYFDCFFSLTESLSSGLSQYAASTNIHMSKEQFSVPPAPATICVNSLETPKEYCLAETGNLQSREM